MAKIQKKIETTIPFNSIFLFSTQRLSIRWAAIPTRLCRLPEQEVHQPSNRAPTLQSSHRLHRTHRTFWQIRASHRLHRFSQKSLGGAAVSAAPTKQSGTNITILPRNTQNTQKRLAEKKNLCTSVKSVGGSSPPEASVNSVSSVGGLAQANLEWVLWKEFGGQRGYGRDAIPSYENSHGLHGCAQIRRQNAT